MKWIIGLVVIAVAAVGFWYTQRDVADNTSETANENGDGSFAQQAGEEESFSGSLFDLAKKGRDYECMFTQNSGGYETEGHIYIADSGKKMSGTFITKDVPQIGTMEMHMISDATHVYTWHSLMPQGFQSPRTDTGVADGTTGTQGQSFDFNQAMNYRCTPWSVDNSVFDIPSTVTFQSI